MRFRKNPASIYLWLESNGVVVRRSLLVLIVIFINFWVVPRWAQLVSSSLLVHKKSKAAATAKSKKTNRLTKTSMTHPEWCPYATCKSSPLCQPCSRRWLIIIATGRSGSTTLMSMLGQLPHVRMAGEENGQLIYAKQFVENLVDSKSLQFDSESFVSGPYQHNPIPPGAMICPIQQLFEVMNPPSQNQLLDPQRYDDNDTILGFKFIRFQDTRFGGKDLESGVQFLKEYFPCARFVVNIRGDTASQIESWKRAFKPENDKILEKIPLMNDMLKKVAALLGEDRARLIDMDTWSNTEGSGLQVLNDLIEWLGFRNCRYTSILHQNKDNYALDSTNSISLGKNCTFTGINL